MRDVGRAWQRNLRPFLSLGLATARWLRDSAPVLAAAADGAVIEGPFPTHLDVRSDNVCFRDGRAVMVDWNHAVLAHPDLDIAGWAPSLQAEGGPAPEEILPGRGQMAAVISGYFAKRAGMSIIPAAPRVREVQRQQPPHVAALGGARAGTAAARWSGGVSRVRAEPLNGCLRGPD